ncbi:MAG: hypothetical protein IKU94_11780 [Bacteroidaceae bacterium]|nr:hypothetical protein [Bacteroidaceae bacterium]
MKSIKNIFNALLALVVVAGFASCADEPEYTPAGQLEGMQVYFPATNPSQFDLEQKDSSFEIEVSREVADADANIAIAVTCSNDANYTFPSTVNFKAGEKTAKLNVAYKGSQMEYAVYDTIAISIADQKNVSPYSISNYEFVAGVPAPWTAWFNSKSAWTAAGYDAAAWPLGDEKTTTCDYTYSLYWAGVDAGLNISYRQYLLDPAIAQFKIDNWGSGVSLIIDYNTVTKNCQVAPQYAADNSNYGAVTIGDVSHWQGSDYYASYPCYYNPETGQFVLNVAYYVSAGSFGYGPETIQVAGFYIPDYSVDAQYLGIFTDKEQKAYAQIALNAVGVDAEKAMAYIVEKGADDAAVADAMAAGDVQGTDLVIGYNNIAIEEGLTGELKVVVCTVAEGAAMDVQSYSFEYYGGGANPWTSLGMGMYTEGIVCSLYNIEAQTYEVEILESNDNPGLYRVVNPYGEQWAYAEANTMTPVDYMEVNATDAEAVYIAPQMLGVNLEGGDTELGYATYAAYLYAAGQATLEDLKTLGYMGKVVDGVITFPTFKTQSGNLFQGVVYYGSSKAYNGGVDVKITLPGAVSAEAAKAAVKPAARKFVRNMKPATKMLMDKNAKRLNPILRLVDFK